MTSTPLDVKVIYDASAARGRRGSVVTRTGVAQSRWLVVGLLNLLIAGGLCYGAWWRVDREFIYPKLFMHSTIPGVDLNLLSKKMFPKKKGATRKPLTTRQRSAPAPEPKEASPAGATTASRTVDARTIQLWGVAYAWLALAAIATGAMSLSSGSLIGRWRGDALRRIGKTLAGGALLGLAYAAFAIVQKYGMEYPTGHLRLFMGGLAGLCFLVGLGVGGRVRGFSRFAAGAVIISAVGSVIGLLIWSGVDAVPSEQASLTFLLMVFAIHSSWGWILWFVAPRLPR